MLREEDCPIGEDQWSRDFTMDVIDASTSDINIAINLCEPTAQQCKLIGGMIRGLGLVDGDEEEEE